MKGLAVILFASFPGKEATDITENNVFVNTGTKNFIEYIK
jgi:hypothetical protein